MLAASPYKIWDTLKQFHPYKKEILILVRMLNKIGAKRTMIAAALYLQGWQNFCGVSEWTVEDVKDILEGYSAEFKFRAADPLGNFDEVERLNAVTKYQYFVFLCMNGA